MKRNVKEAGRKTRDCERDAKKKKKDVFQLIAIVCPFPPVYEMPGVVGRKKKRKSPIRWGFDATRLNGSFRENSRRIGAFLIAIDVLFVSKKQESQARKERRKRKKRERKKRRNSLGKRRHSSATAFPGAIVNFQSAGEKQESLTRCGARITEAK